MNVSYSEGDFSVVAWLVNRKIVFIWDTDTKMLSIRLFKYHKDVKFVSATRKEVYALIKCIFEHEKLSGNI